jgi:hypothetical protein
MTGKKFLNSLANGKSDVIQLFLDMLEKLKLDYCVIGGLAVNAYAEPVASLDLDLVLAIGDIEILLRHIEATKEKFSVKKFAHSLILEHPDSDLRIQIQTDEIYQPFIKNGTTKKVLGYEMKVASLEDLLKGKILAYSDEERRKSKRQKDLADIMRLIESYPNLTDLLPEKIKKLTG